MPNSPRTKRFSTVAIWFGCLVGAMIVNPSEGLFAKPLNANLCPQKDQESPQQTARALANAAEELRSSQKKLFTIPSDEEARLYSAVVNCDSTFRGIPWARLSRWASAKGFEAAGEAFLKKAKELSPRSPETLLAEAQSELSRRQYDQAFRICSSLLKDVQDPNHPLRADVFLCAGASGLEAHYVEVARLALVDLEAAMVSFGNSPPEALAQIHFDLGRAWEIGTDKVRYGNGSDLVKASEYFSKALAGSSPHLWAHFHRALIFAHQEKFQEAFNENELFLSVYPRYHVAVYNKACFLLKLGDREGGLKFLERAIQVGFRDRDHILKDPDLSSVRDDERFQNLIKDLPPVSTPMKSQKR